MQRRVPTASTKSSIERNAREEALLAEALTGDRKAWSAFCRGFDNLIVGCVLRVLRRYTVSFGSADLADLVSEVWVALFRDDCRKLRLYDRRRGYRLSSWIALIATNTTIDQLRLRGAECSYLEDLELPERWLVDRRAPDQELETRQSAELARRALSALTREERDFLAACYGEEQAPVALAAELGIRIGTVYSRKFKTREKLAKIVAALEVGPPPTMTAKA